MLQTKIISVLWMCVFLLLGVGSCFSASSLDSGTQSNPALLDSLRIRYVDTGKIGYVSIQLERQLRPLLAKTTHFSFGSGRPENHEVSWPPYSDSLFIGVGRGIRWYLQDRAPRGLWLEGSLAIAYVSVSFEKSQTERPPESDLSGVLYGAIGRSWLLPQGWGVELLAGIMTPSLYTRPGVIHSLEPDFFAGFSLSSAF